MLSGHGGRGMPVLKVGKEENCGRKGIPMVILKAIGVMGICG